MNKRVATGTAERGKVRVRFFEVEMEGGTDALQDSVRALTSALNRPTSARGIGLTNGTRHEHQVLEAGAEPDQDSLSTDSDEELDGQQVVESDPRPSRQRAKRTPPTPKILDDARFDEGDPTWPAFAEEKSPSSDTTRIAVVATWFKRVKQIDTITINHAYTAFKFAGWPTPDDIGQAFRNAKRGNNWFGTDGAGNWTINIIGLNAVDKLKKGE